MGLLGVIAEIILMLGIRIEVRLILEVLEIELYYICRPTLECGLYTSFIIVIMLL